MTMERDCIEYVKKYQKCQMYNEKINALSAPLFSMTSPWPFAVWRIDVIGSINSKAINGHWLILVDIGYFSK
jgi:hypothetical protein